MARTASEGAERTVRVRAAPPLEPPFDDEPGTDPPANPAPMLPMDWPGRRPGSTRPPDRRPPGGPTLAPACGPDEPPPPAGRQPGAGTAIHPNTHSSPARVAARRFVGVCVEVLAGRRPVQHLRAITLATELGDITDRVIRRCTRVYLGRLGPAGRPTGRPEERITVSCVRVCEPRDGVAELVAVLRYGPRSWALAARLEQRGDAWLCTAADVP